MHPPRQQVQEFPQEIQIHTSDVGHLEYWAYPEEEEGGGGERRGEEEEEGR